MNLAVRTCKSIGAITSMMLFIVISNALAGSPVDTESKLVSSQPRFIVRSTDVRGAELTKDSRKLIKSIVSVITVASVLAILSRTGASVQANVSCCASFAGFHINLAPKSGKPRGTDTVFKIFVMGDVGKVRKINAKGTEKGCILLSLLAGALIFAIDVTFRITFILGRHRLFKLANGPMKSSLAHATIVGSKLGTVSSVDTKGIAIRVTFGLAKVGRLVLAVLSAILLSTTVRLRAVTVVDDSTILLFHSGTLCTVKAMVIVTVGAFNFTLNPKVILVAFAVHCIFRVFPKVIVPQLSFGVGLDAQTAVSMISAVKCAIWNFSLGKLAMFAFKFGAALARMIGAVRPVISTSRIVDAKDLRTLIIVTTNVNRSIIYVGGMRFGNFAVLSNVLDAVIVLGIVTIAVVLLVTEIIRDFETLSTVVALVAVIIARDKLSFALEARFVIRALAVVTVLACLEPVHLQDGAISRLVIRKVRIFFNAVPAPAVQITLLGTHAEEESAKHDQNKTHVYFWRFRIE